MVPEAILEKLEPMIPSQLTLSKNASRPFQYDTNEGSEPKQAIIRSTHLVDKPFTEPLRWERVWYHTKLGLVQTGSMWMSFTELDSLQSPITKTQACIAETLSKSSEERQKHHFQTKRPPLLPTVHPPGISQLHRSPVSSIFQ